MEINDHEALLIAALADNAGFRLLLEALQADSDDVLLAIEAARTDEEERRLCAEWKALRRIRAKLDDLTQYFKASVEEVTQNLSPQAALFSPESLEPDFFGKLISGDN